jgi:hypothetical protein
VSDLDADALCGHTAAAASARVSARTETEAASGVAVTLGKPPAGAMPHLSPPKPLPIVTMLDALVYSLSPFFHFKAGPGT